MKIVYSVQWFVVKNTVNVYPGTRLFRPISSGYKIPFRRVGVCRKCEILNVNVFILGTQCDHTQVPVCGRTAPVSMQNERKRYYSVFGKL